jgi:mannose-6-phosphate isomerase
MVGLKMNFLINNREERPWGYYYITFESNQSKSKIIVINQGQQISYQYHNKRSEDWIILEGNGIVTLENEEFEVSCGSHVHIKAGQKHRIKSTDSSIIFVEVQTGEYFGEDDIVRLEDIYGRK